MEINDQFQLTLTSEEYDMLNEVMPFAASFDFTEHHEGRTFDILWDKILNAEHQIKFEETKWIHLKMTKITHSWSRSQQMT